jgi:hypothetical protein
MIDAAVFLLLTGAMATAAASRPGQRALANALQRCALTLLALICLGVALSMILPNGPWFLPAALSINGSACVAHGIGLNLRVKMISGFLFCVLGGIQLGIVLILAAVAA